MIAIVDYGLGNLYSLSRSLNYIGYENIITRDERVIAGCEKLILPGVGAFGDAIDKLEETGLKYPVREKALSGAPMLGICLGMQLLFNKSYEYGEHDGLALIPGDIMPLSSDISLKVPHMGWNALEIKRECELLKYVRNGEYVYYVHSYYAKNCEDAIIATSEYGVDVPGVVACGNVFGTQFHPEKSGDVGLSILRGFCEMRGDE